jgi:glucose-1-phosphate cytidylyltransferase
MNTPTQDFADVPVILLCGGRSVVLHAESPTPCNKALLSLQDKPLFWWTIRHYALYGARNFILATGIQGDAFAPALLALGALARGSDPQVFDLTVNNQPCQIRIVPTGAQANTAQRLLACKPWVEHSNRFALTYSDTISDVDLGAELAFHTSEQRVAALVSAKFPVRFRVLGIRSGETAVRAFASRPVIEAASINGGYYLFTQAIWQTEYGLKHADAMENKPLEQLAQAGQLAAFSHSGAWQNCDSERDFECIERMVKDWS